ncbi:MAG: ABC transporter ATP-binding protein [Hyphomicrobiales bacterium]|nr:ABC transporter ATP-binding protein [Hyphomicrobiales bacterium]
MALLDVRGLTVEFATRAGPFRAVEGVDVTVDAGETLAIVGESGSGKSVAMLAVMGLLPWNAKVTAERIEFDGRDLRALSPRERRALVGKDLAMIFQEPMSALNPCFTVGFQIAEALSAHGAARGAEARKRAVALLAEVGIPEPEARARAFPHQMSGGMCQRAMIAMAIALRPKLLIADEPTTALDVTVQAQILDLLKRLRAETGMALVLVTHDMGVVAETADRVVVQYAGRRAEGNAAAALFAAPRHPYTAALLDALPERATGERLAAIPGAVPGPSEPRLPCAFAPRCPRAQDVCRTQAPPRASTGGEGYVHCHFPLPAPAGERAA